MHAVYRSRFQHDKKRIQIFMLVHTLRNHIHKLVGARLIIVKWRREVFVFLKVHGIDNVGL